LWTPPHFWALALFMKSDYGAAGIPMLPNVAGRATTRNQIFGYSWAMAAAALAPWAMGMTGALYGVPVLALTVMFIALAFTVWRNPATEAAEMKAEKRLFGFSIIYLFLLFGLLAIDRVLAA
jgi:protoheme IX farnesyltransferase